MKKSVTMEHVDPMLEEVGHLCGPFGDRSVTSTEKQMVLLGHVPSVHLVLSVQQHPCLIFFFSTDFVLHPGSNTGDTEETQL